jgi:hypothetical protein
MPPVEAAWVQILRVATEYDLDLRNLLDEFRDVLTKQNARAIRKWSDFFAELAVSAEPRWLKRVFLRTACLPFHHLAIHETVDRGGSRTRPGLFGRQPPSCLAPGTFLVREAEGEGVEPSRAGGLALCSTQVPSPVGLPFRLPSLLAVIYGKPGRL